MKKFPIILFAAASSVCCNLVAQTPAQTTFFENKIRPILANNCYKCHSQESPKVKGGLFLDTREGLLKGGETGAAIIPGDPDKSLLIKAVRYTDPDLQMPPKDKKLSDAQIADLVTWVKMGAPDPRVATAEQKTWTDSGKKHWAYQPVNKPAAPTVSDSSWIKTPVDNFILAKLEEKNLKPNPTADKRTLIRRASFDLIGLPPTPEDVDAFEADNSPNAFEKVVDRLLASSHYGERWGRHWLDVARYSDTKGQIRRNREDENNPYAWTYRDYVIRSFNDDKPFNVFIIEQLAADKLPSTSRNAGNLAALGFLTVGDRFMEMQNDIINDRIDVVTKGFLGMTVSCARCHDHKFDPIPTKDYYSLHGIFASCNQPEVEPVISKIVETPSYLEYYKQRTDLEKERQNIEARFAVLRKSRNREGIQQIQKDMRQNRGAIARLEMTSSAAPMRAMVLEDSARPKDSPVFIRGETGNKGEIVPRRFPEILSGPYRPAFTNGSGRLELAYAIASRNNPLTPRVLINRLWQHHFGEGFVNTPDDFGTMSEAPSHPELLDYLAARFMDEGWSMKKMHKLIMLSSVYQQSSANNPRYAEMDPGNRLLWRANIRRLEFEAVRDSLLAIGGKLDNTMFGRPVDFEKNPDSMRRTVYGFINRSDVDDVLVNFDFANPDMPNGKRYETTVPQQALFFMNSPIVVEQAKRLVALSQFKNCKDDKARVEFLYDRIYQRLPRPEEIGLGIEFISMATPAKEVASNEIEVRPVSTERVDRKKLQQQLREQQMKKRQQLRGGNQDTRQRPPLTPWEEYAHALLQANETSFVN